MNAQEENFKKVLGIKAKLEEWRDKAEAKPAAPSKWKSQKVYAKGSVIETAKRGPKKALKNEGPKTQGAVSTVTGPA